MVDLGLAAELGSRWGAVTNTVRSPQRNRRVGGAANSFHLSTRRGGPRAIDIARAPGVRHADIEADYRAAGYDLIESLDEGDHSHFAFRRGPARAAAETAAASDIPAGFEVVNDRPPASVPSSLGGLIGTARAGDSGNSQIVASAPPTGQSDLVSLIDPKKIGRLQAALDAGASYGSIVGLSKELGVSPNLGDLRRAVAWRDKNGRGARIIPPVERRKPTAVDAGDTITPRDTGTGRTGAIVRGAANSLTGMLAGEIQGLGRTTREWLEGDIPEGQGFLDRWGTNNNFFEGSFAFDRERYPVSTFAAELGAGLAIPFGAGARTAVQLGKVGAAYGGVYGFGDASGGVVDRIPGAVAGAGLGAAGGYAIGKGIDLVGPYARRGYGALRSRLYSSTAGADEVVPTVARNSAYESAPVVQDSVQGSPGARPGTVQGTIRARSDEGSEALPEGFEIVTPGGQTSRRDPLSPNGGSMGGGAGPHIGRQRDYINIADVPPGWQVAEEPPLGGVRPMGEQPSPDEIASLARGIRPEDVTPIPGNTVGSLDEFNAIGDPRPLIQPPNEFAELGMRQLPSGRNRRGPLDLISWVRSQPWTLSDEGGDLAQMGIGNAPRDMDFAGGEQFLGRLVGGTNARSLDDAAGAAWEAGFFPNHVTRPSVGEFLDALDSTNRGSGRYFRPDDLEEVDRFEAARADRGMIEAAAQEGSPLAEDIGRPIGMEDLRANDPPATAYEELPRLGGRVANIDIGKLETRGDIRRALQNVETRFGGFDAARRGRISQAETAALASELKMTPDDLLRRRKGQALNAEQALAARQILAKSADELTAMASRAVGGSDEDVATFQKALVRHAAIQEQVTGATAEAGRTLAQFKMAARSKAVSGRVLGAMIEGGGGRDRIEDAAKAILDLQQRGEPPAKINETARLLMTPTWKDKAIELWYNSLLSGPQTHVVNVLSNAATSALQLPEQATAAALGLARRGVQRARGKPDDFDRVLLSEIGARTVGLMQGAAEGLRAFGRTVRTGEVPDFVTKVESRSQRAISGLKGEVIRTPSRFLAAEDEFFKAVARRMELNGLAVREARKGGYRGEALRARVQELTENPTEEMLARSLDYARYLTYQRPLGKLGQRVSATTQEHPWLKLFLPFVRTPTNIFKFVAERSPAAPVMKEVRDNFRAGGERRALAMARMMLGTGLALQASQWAASGRITGGGPADRNAKDILRADGWQPYSIRIGNRYYSYQRFDPIASTLGIAADLVDHQSHLTEKQREKSAGLLVASIIKNMANKTWLSGATDLAGALEDPERNLPNLMARLAGSVAVPAVVAQAARTIDPVQRDTKEPSFAIDDPILSYARQPIARIQSRLPILSRQLPAQRNVWGQEIRGEGGIGPDFVSPAWQSTRRNDPLNAEMLAMGAKIGKPSPTVGKHKLSRNEALELQRVAGEYLQNDLRAAIADPEWRTLTTAERNKWVEELKDQARADARADLFPRYIGSEPSDIPPGFEVVPPGFQIVSRPR